DVGCGSGVLTRALGEAGLLVHGIEGAPQRAEAARERCRDLANVTVSTANLPGALTGAEPYDLILMCGVLEYSERYADGAAAVLAGAAGALAEYGVLVLAIENQLGLKYLLGGVEDHHGKAWTGLADYPGPDPVPRTWSRRALSGMLRAAGLPAQRWLLPFPDYKLPRVVLDEAAFAATTSTSALRAAAELVEKLVRDPLQGTFGGNDAAVSGRIAYQLAVEQGIGPDVAPSFLVLAARSPRALADAAEPGLAWLVSGARRAGWRRVRRLDRDGQLRTVHRGGGVANPWLSQRHTGTEPLRAGRPMDALLLDAMRTGDLDRLDQLLRIWRSVCTEGPRSNEGLRPHPFLPRPGEVEVLPGDHLDIHPGNLIVDPDGGISRVDLEWHARDAVDAELAMLRALLEFAKEALHNHAPLPWPACRTIRDLLRRLCEPVELAGALRARWPELVSAEAQLQELVTGRPAAEIAAGIEADSTAERPPPLWQLAGGLAALRAEHAARLRAERVAEEAKAWFAEREAALLEELAQQRSRADELTDRLHRAGHELAVVRAEAEVTDDRIGLAFRELATTVREARHAWQAAEQAEAGRLAALAESEAARAQAAKAAARLQTLERSRVVRIGRRLVWPTGRLVRGLRDLALARPGAEPDGVQRLAPVTGRVAGRYRRAAASARDAGLLFDLPVPPEPVVVGAGQVVELRGWVCHSGIGVRTVRLLAGERDVAVRRGYLRPDVAQTLRAEAVPAPMGSGVLARVPLPRVATAGEIPLAVLVELSDGTTLRRELPPLRVVPRPDIEPVDARWPADGPRVAVCLASYRPDPVLLAEQLDSLRRQQHANWVCVISDDCSGDEGVATLRRLTQGDNRFVIVPNGSRLGFYRNFERALALAPADADAIALCDQDDIWDPDKIGTLLSRLDDPEVTLAYSDMRLIDRQGGPIAPSFWRRRCNQWWNLDSLLLLNTVTGAASMLRADVVRERVLPFPPGTPSAFHDQWTGVAALAGGRFEYVDRPLYSYRQHQQAVTGHRDGRLDEGLPPVPGRLRRAVGRLGLPTERGAELEAVAEHELRRVAQFATVLLLRDGGKLSPAVRSRLGELARIEDDVRPLLTIAAEARAETAGAERYLLAAAMRWTALRRGRLRPPVLP
ncbi:MAG TPA: glycosyltransferase, partial [Pseudonocardiaceae bacterium]|nr:glycosyltransferase [Pseudonocardiaceae bacterium]